MWIPVLLYTACRWSPGWIYMDQACGKFEEKTWKGAYVALRDPKTADWSVVLCTNRPETITLQVAQDLK